MNETLIFLTKPIRMKLMILYFDDKNKANIVMSCKVGKLLNLRIFTYNEKYFLSRVGNTWNL